nr:MAG TPA: hypothetical protein [Caudoviricetes sp.]
MGLKTLSLSNFFLSLSINNYLKTLCIYYLAFLLC